MKTIQAATNLLNSTKIIREHSETLNQMTGVRFNVFDLLGHTSHENSHSLFIAELLNPRGSHGQGDDFLKAFLEKIKTSRSNSEGSVQFPFNSENSDTKNAGVITEHHLGPKDLVSGGRVDIFIKMGEQKIFVENKIYAGLQERQLERYLDPEKNAQVLFLTLGDEYNDRSSSEAQSIDPLRKRDRLFYVSYRTEIVTWLERCLEISSSKPTLRETIAQYLSLIKRLTGLGGNRYMNEQLKTMITRDSDNIEAFFELTECRHEMLTSVGERLQEIGRCVADRVEGLEWIESDFIFDKLWASLRFQTIDYKDRKLCIDFQFQKNYQNLRFGVSYTEENKEPQNALSISVSQLFQKEFGECESPSQWWAAIKPMNSPWRNWGSKQYADILSSDPNNQKLGEFGVLLLKELKRVKEVLDGAIEGC